MSPLKNVLVATSIVIGVVCSPVTLAQNPDKTWLQYATPEEAGFSSERLQAVVDLYQKNGASALMIVYNGNVLLWRGDITRRYDSHSMRKSLISALYGIYSARGSIDIRKSLATLGIDDSPALTAEERSATIQDLLKARSGVYLPAFGEAKSMKDSRPGRGTHPPNTFHYYNNWDFNVLGAIFQRETGKGLFEAFDESLAKPLQMEDFRPIDGRFWRDSTLKTIYPKYDIKISARDLARFGTLYCNDGIWGGRPLLTRSWIAESFAPYSTIDHGSYKDSYGYLWWGEVLDDSIQTYSARGWGGHFLVVVPKYNLVVVKRHDTFAGTGGDSWIGSYVRQILAARVLEPASRPRLMPLVAERPEQHFLSMSEPDLRKYEQEIFRNGRPRRIRYGSYGLLFDDWFVLHPVSGTQFFIEDLNQHMYFKLAGGAAVFDRIE